VCGHVDGPRWNEDSLMTRSMLASLVLCGSLWTGVAGCDLADDCGVQGETQACSCSGTQKGAQVCEPAGVWGECKCDGTVPLPTEDGGLTDGSAGTGAVVDSGVGTDAALMTDANVSTDSAMGTDSAAGDAGTDSAVPVAAYAKCTMDSECNVGDKCLIASVGGVMKGACAPACTMDTDCAAPAAGGTSTAKCPATDLFCRIDCSGLIFPMTCPTGTTCQVSGAAQICVPD
jgi:hypothetical protein